ncbi:hypothetical protein [Desulfovibrio inopinatus]|uniref:hypothetical protein n=1 Tax=Desulfovibrio inopinatus TaxID=102109 RepID=UPI0004272C8D|nr:hypothetical protein [Desulfovibrio inopinatus]
MSKAFGIKFPQELAGIRISRLMNTYLQDSSERHKAEVDMSIERNNAQPRIIEQALEGSLVNRSA